MLRFRPTVLKITLSLLALALCFALQTQVAAQTISSLSWTSGPVGIQETITGSGFGGSQGTSTVTFNGTAGTPCATCWSDTNISVLVPAGATSGNVVVNVGGTNSNPVAFTVTPLPYSWSDSDIGSTGAAGSASFANGTFTVKGAGAGIYSTADAFHFVYQTLSGDGSIIARVSGIQGGQVGLMIRETLAANSTNTFVYFNPNTAQIYQRTSTGSSSSYLSTVFVSPASPYWLRLDRAGSTFTSYISKDGFNWTQVSTNQTISMAETVSVGLAVSSGGAGTLATATFDNVSVNSTASSAPIISSVSTTTTPIGSQLWIYGNNFGSTQNGSVVSLNGTPMIINSWSATAISITIPAGATSGALSVAVAPSMNGSNTVTLTITNQPLPQGWLDRDIGAVGLTGSATYSNGTFTIQGAGQGIWTTQDSFHFVYQPLSGDGTIVARVSNMQNISSPEVGLMIRESAHVDSTNIFIYFTPNTGNLNSRTATGGSTTQQSASFINPSYPYWVKLSRSGNVFTAFTSKDSINWTQIGSQTIVMAQNVFIGMAVSNQTTSTLLTASMDSVAVSSDVSVPPVINSVSATTGNVGAQVTIYGSSFGPTQGSSTVELNGAPVTVNTWSDTAIGVTIPAGATSGYLEVLLGPSINSSNPIEFQVTTQPLPSGWLDADVGQTSTIGTATYSGGSFTLTSMGAGLVVGAGTSDGFHFVYQTLTGDGALVARVTSITNESTYNAGIIMRDSLNPGAKSIFVSFYPNTGAIFYRTSTGGSTSNSTTFFAHSYSPYWVKLARTGNSFSAFVSADGANWTQVATTQTITMGQTIYVGLADTSDGSRAVTASYDNVSISVGTMPIVTGLTPASGALAAQVTLTGINFGSSQGTGSVRFNGAAATSILSWTNTQIIALVPSNATTGPVSVIVGSIQSNTNFSYTVYNPVVSSVTPNVGQYGSVVTVAGSGFGSSQNTGSQVSINGTSVSVVNWSDTSLKVAIPSNATSGPLTVSVGGVTSNGVPFYFENLSVTGISPASGSAGSAVTITGTGFGSAQTTSTVDFYGAVAAIQNWSDTQIVATVPANAPSGSVDVTVGGIVWNGPQFTVTQTMQLTDSLSNQSSYTSALIGGIWVPSVGQGSGCSSCTQRGNISYTYDSAGDVLTKTDELGHTTTYTYDSNGNVLTVTVPRTSTTTATTTYTYNSFGEVLTATDPMGFVTTNTYDANGNLLSVATPSPDGSTAASLTQFTYNSLGELTKITDPLNHATTLTYTAAGLIATITDAQSNVTTYAYDARGNRTSVTDALNHQTTFTYDAMNRLTKITYPDTTTTQFAYDIRGRRTSVTDQNGKVTSYAYDDADRLTSVTDAASNVAQYAYDSESNLISITDANLNTTSFAYDAFGRVSKTTFPSSALENYSYDAVGNLASKTDRKNQTINYAYDYANRLVQKSYPDSTAVNYSYDNDSRLTQVTDPTGTYSFTFDNMGQLTGTTTAYAFLTGRSFTSSYTYDKASNRTGFTDPESGSTTYAYDALNRLQTLTPPSAFTATGNFGFSYDALSRRTQLTRPNSVTTNYTYDNLSRLMGILHQLAGSTIDGATYAVDNAGNRTAKTDLQANVTTNYGYDAIYQLLSATQGANTTESYAYDPVGNRTSSLGVASYTTNSSNELTATSRATFAYDSNGNTITKNDSTGITTYAWDFENRLTSVTLPGTGGTVGFKYDPFGRRIYKSSSAGTSVFTYDGDTLIEEVNVSGTATTRYAQGLEIDQPLAMLRAGTTNYYNADGLGSVTSLTNATGALAQTYLFDSYGKETASSGSLSNPFLYTAREFDVETGIYYYRARYYDPSIGRFISEDPTGFDSGVNGFSYVGNAPTVFDDPSGLDKKPAQTKYCCAATLPSDPEANVLARLVFAEATETSGISPQNSWQEMLAIAFEPINRADYVANHRKDRGVFGAGTSPSISGTIVPQQFGSLKQRKFKSPLRAVGDPRLGKKGQQALCDFLKRAIDAANFALQNPSGDPFDGVFGNRTSGHGAPGGQYYPLPSIPGSNNTFWGLDK